MDDGGEYASGGRGDEGGGGDEADGGSVGDGETESRGGGCPKSAKMIQLGCWRVTQVAEGGGLLNR